MLRELYVQHFVLIDELRLNFQYGLHVFTGETGAGKSLILDATRIVLGGRTSTQVIQRGQSSALVEAVFDIENASLAADMLRTWDMPLDDDGTLVLSRTVYATGRSVCRINGRTATVQMLKMLGDTLVEMQGQHESHALLTSSYQRELVDLFGGYRDTVLAISNAFRTWRDLERELQAARSSERERAQQMDMLQFQINEIEAAALVPGEEVALRSLRQGLMVASRQKEHMERLTDALDHPSTGAITQVIRAESEARTLVEDEADLQQVLDLLSQARIQIEEAAFLVSKYASKMDTDPDRLLEIEDRLVLIRSLSRKYGATTDDILQHLHQAKEALGQLNSHDERTEQLQRDLEHAKRVYMDVALELHQKRLESAARLQAQVCRRLAQLEMNDASFAIDVHSDFDTPSESGYDDVTFLFSGNRGEPLSALQKVASGGELSRTLLALKVVVADVEHIDTLIFDEIDTGVSGEAAQRVAELMRLLGSDKQVLCVTHSAQVAAAGHSHFHIVKDTVEERATTRIEELDTERRRGEIGRLLGSGVSDETALNHADALLESFRRDAITNR